MPHLQSDLQTKNVNQTNMIKFCKNEAFNQNQQKK